MKDRRIIGFLGGRELRYMYRAATTKRIVLFVDFATGSVRRRILIGGETHVVLEGYFAL
jgi:hypothetical protein